MFRCIVCGSVRCVFLCVWMYYVCLHVFVLCVGCICFKVLCGGIMYVLHVLYA